MAADGTDWGDSPVTRQEWRALRRIRRLQIVLTLLFAGGFAGLLIVVLALMRQFMIQAEAGRPYISLSEFAGWALMVAAFAGEGIVNGLLDRTLCPRCGHEFFRLSPHAPIQTRRTPYRKASAFSRLTRVAGQSCCNCELSLGLAAMPEPPESVDPHA